MLNSSSHSPLLLCLPAVCLTAGFYSLVGIFGYLNFPLDAHSNILLNYSGGCWRMGRQAGRRPLSPDRHIELAQDPCGCTFDAPLPARRLLCAAAGNDKLMRVARALVAVIQVGCGPCSSKHLLNDDGCRGCLLHLLPLARLLNSVPYCHRPQIIHYPVNHFPARNATRDLLAQLTGRQFTSTTYNVTEVLAFFAATLALSLVRPPCTAGGARW